MKNFIKAYMTFIIMCLLLLPFLMYCQTNNDYSNSELTVCFDDQVIVETEETEIITYSAIIIEQNTQEFSESSNESEDYLETNSIDKQLIVQTIEEMDAKLSHIEIITDKKEWYLSYKSIIEEYSSIISPPETVYDYFTEDEIYLIQRVVETECYDADFLSKVNVASVVFNRINDGSFGDSVKEVITKPHQFAYKRTAITEDTVLAVEYAFAIEDTTGGCIAFHSNKCSEMFYNCHHVFHDEAGHHFYK